MRAVSKLVLKIKFYCDLWFPLFNFVSHPQRKADGGGEIQSWDKKPTLFQWWLSKINSVVPWEDLVAAISSSNSGSNAITVQDGARLEKCLFVRCTVLRGCSICDYLLQRAISDTHNALKIAERMLFVEGFTWIQINIVGVAAVGKRRNNRFLYRIRLSLFRRAAVSWLTAPEGASSASSYYWNSI